MNLMPLADLLQQNGLGIQGQTIFINQMPVETPLAVMLRTPLSGTKVNYELPGYYKTNFQLIARADGFENGKALSDSVTAALTLVETQVETMYFKYCRPMTLGIPFPVSKGNLIEISTMFECIFIQ
ncbi:minor capsid protein [Ferrovum sp.]|uniref:phage tail terminator protein n=1 Tax=Ferrovum sp. TaxID=2609467 RepID=UPI0026188568|nr:minor capsid protein [Ferrovum sp.]